jgi:Mg2+ and Co2+ transporter CorA
MIIIDAAGVRPVAGAADVAKSVAAGRFFWLDIFDPDATGDVAHLAQAGLDSADIAWALRFGQIGRMQIEPGRLRAATWIADRAGNLLELHLIGRKRCIVTVWRGGAKELDDIRAQFAERVAGFEDSPYQAAGILLQLLLGTLDYVTESLDISLDDLRLRVDQTSRSDDFAMLTRRLRALQSTGSSFNRYSSAVRSATVGIEVLTGMDARGAEELNDYVEQVEDIGEQLDQRRKWMSDIMHDFATNIAQKQGEQINRLTLVSLIFLPVTALTGFFGMNFDWMVRSLSGGETFFVLGVLLPASCVGLTFAWLVRRKLVRFRLWRERIQEADAQIRPTEVSGGTPLNAPTATTHSAIGLASRSQESATTGTGVMRLAIQHLYNILS